jgi:hypothetical protein
MTNIAANPTPIIPTAIANPRDPYVATAPDPLGLALPEAAAEAVAELAPLPVCETAVENCSQLKFKEVGIV